MPWGVAAAVAGAAISANASSSAAGQQAGAANNATQAQLQMFNQVQHNLQPYQQSGVGALNSLDYLLGIGGGGYGGYGGGVQNGPQTGPTGYAQPGSPGPSGTAPIVNGGGPGFSVGGGGQRLVTGPGSPAGGGAVTPGTGAGHWDSTNPDGSGGGPPHWVPDAQPGQGSPQSMQTQPQQISGPAQGGGAPGGPGGGPGDAGGLPYGYLTHQFNTSDLQGNLSPNYNFQLNQGLGQAQNAAAAGGGMLGGNALQGMNAFAQNYAQNAYQQAFSNYTTNQNNIAGRLGSLAQLGQASATGSASGAPLFAQGISNTIQGAGQAGAAGTVGAANAINSGLTNAAGYYYMNQQPSGMASGWDQMMNGGSYYGGPGIPKG